MSDIWVDLNQFFRKLRIKRYFDDIDSDNIINPFKIKSTWSPSEGQDAILDVYIKAVKTHVLSLLNNKKRRYNLNKSQHQGLKELIENPQVVLKKADKGSAVVLMNSNDYVQEINRQLSNQENYIKLHDDPTDRFSNNILEVIMSMRDLDYIDDNTFDYLNIPKPKPGRFYILPKIHRAHIPGRPICFICQHPSEHISQFLDFHIRKYVNTLPTYIRDTQDFILKLKQLGGIPLGSILCTMDVTSLYTNIPNKEGIDAVLDHVRWDTDAKIPPHKIGKLLELILHTNHFEFNGELFL